MKRSILMEYGTLVPSGNRLAEKTLATLYDPFNEELKCPSVSYPAIMAFVLYIEKHGITRGLKNNSSNETALYVTVPSQMVFTLAASLRHDVITS